MANHDYTDPSKNTNGKTLIGKSIMFTLVLVIGAVYKVISRISFQLYKVDQRRETEVMASHLNLRLFPRVNFSVSLYFFSLSPPARFRGFPFMTEK